MYPSLDAEVGSIAGRRRRRRSVKRFNDVVKEDMKLAGAREEDAEDTAGWRQMIGCEPSLCGTAERGSRSQLEVSARATRTHSVSVRKRRQSQSDWLEKNTQKENADVNTLNFYVVKL